MPTPNWPENFLYPRYLRFSGAGISQATMQIWATYLDFVDMPGIVVKTIAAQCTLLGVGAQTAEFGLYSSPTGPNGSAQTLSRLTASGTLTDMTTGSPPFVVRSSVLTYAIPAGTHVWAVSRTSFATGQPSFSEGLSHTPLGDTLWIQGSNATNPLTSAPAATLVMSLPSMANVNHGAPGMWTEEV